MARRSSHRRERSPGQGDAGAAFVEFALVAPLFAAMLWGLVTVVSLARARLQLANVAHCVAREAQSGVQDPGVLTEIARAYGRSCGMGQEAADSLVVETGAGKAGLGLEAAGAFGSVVRMASGWTRIAVRVRVRVPDALRLLTGPVELRCHNTCVIGTWKAPWSLLNDLIKMPDPRAQKKK